MYSHSTVQNRCIQISQESQDDGNPNTQKMNLENGINEVKGSRKDNIIANNCVLILLLE